MKKILPSSKKMRFLMIVLVSLLVGVVSNAQTWTIYDGSALPNAATPAWASGDVGTPAAVYSIVTTPDNSFLYDTTSASGDKQSWKLNITKPLSATWIIRTKTAGNPASMEFEMNALTGTSTYRINVKLVNNAKGGYLQTNYLGTNFSYPADTSLTVKNFHTYRITVENATSFKIYLDENPTAIVTGTATATTTNSQFLRFGDVGSTYTAGYVDWMAWDVTGAYAPGTTLPTGVIVDGAGSSTSTDATLSALTSSAGTLSPVFAAGTTTYSVVLPAGTTTIPTIAATVNEAHAIAVITQPSSVTGSGTVAVTAQDGIAKNTYTVNFSVATALSTDATLSALTVSTGTLSPVFAAGTITYSVVLPAGTASVPTIGATVNESHAISAITQASSVTGAGTVVVTAQDGTKKTYTVNFSLAAPAAPVASAATNVAKTSFSANWAASTGATGYYLDVATDNTFASFVTGYNNKDVANVTTFSVTGLTAATTYYYRVRANNGTASANSNTITVLSLGTGVSTLAANALKIAVSTDLVTIEAANNNIVALQVADINGKLMVEKNVGSTSATVSTEGWSSGIYVFTIQTKDGVETKKIGIVK